jgi:hypothetical protein
MRARASVHACTSVIIIIIIIIVVVIIVLEVVSAPVSA